jgi:aminocarboxymuconate-semialdehyde decarboxylase
MRKTDVHAHVILPEMLGKAGRYGPEIDVSDDGRGAMRVGPYVSRVSSGRGLTADALLRMGDASVRLQEMDERGIEKMCVSVSPLFYLYWAEPEVAVPFAHVQNDALANYCAADPARLFFFSTLPLPDVAASIEEVHRTKAMGARAVNIGTDDLGGLELDSEELWPLYDAISKAGLPIFVHPYPSPMAEGRPDKYNLSWIVGYTSQETTAFARLTLGGVFDDFPDLQVSITHGGGAVPFQIGRLEMGREVQPDVRAKKPVAEYIRTNLWFDILVHDVAARRFLLETVGADRLLVGDNYGGWDAADGFAMLDELALPAADAEKIAWRNAEALFHLGPEKKEGQ